MSDFTSGPWFVHDFSGPEVSENPGPQDVTVSCDTPASITVAFMGNALTAGLPEARANARLIAAAPDMLTALTSLNAVLTQAYGEPNAAVQAHIGELAAEPWLAARAAIAKATA